MHYSFCKYSSTVNMEVYTGIVLLTFKLCIYIINLISIDIKVDAITMVDHLQNRNKVGLSVHTTV
jgi:hypothetical protein